MIKEKNPLLSDDFLDEVIKEINQTFGGFHFEAEENQQIKTE